MKQRFSSLDVTVIAHELSNSLSSLRVSNIYDLSSRIFLFKFQKPGSREQLIIDSGFRCHLTQYARTTATEPSPFVERLRKLLRTRRVTSVKQIGTDRIIEFQFSDGQYRLFLEFYAAGNIVLTDSNLKVLALLRAVNEGEEHERLRIGLQYDLSMRQNYEGVPELSIDRIKDALQKSIARREKEVPTGKKQRKEKDLLRKAIVISMPEFPPLLIDHAFKVKGFDSTLKPEQVVEDNSSLQTLLGVLQEAGRVLKQITTSDVAKGYILARRNNLSDNVDESPGTLLYEDFHPFKPSHFAEDPAAEYLNFEGFNKTVDEFFSSVEGQKLESRLHEREATAKRKLEQAREDHAKRLGGLQEAQQVHVRKADAIKANVERVHEATGAVNGLIEKGMDWVEIGRLIEREQSQGNAVAQLIKLPLKLHENTITILLAEQTYDDDEDEGYDSVSTLTSSDSEDERPAAKRAPSPKKEDRRLAIDINLGLSPWQNANDYYSEKKTAAVKEEKTARALDQALKSTEKKITSDLKKGLQQEKDVLRPIRGKFWFEKFNYFISSDGYLVIGGKDAQQQEIIYQRHMNKGDAYVSAELNGAVPFVIKNHAATPDAPLPPSTLSQAGSYCVCTSHAWDSKAVFSAWWVMADEVSKTGRTGEFLPPGAFNIKGKKNFLPPAQLLLGFGIMFQITEESKANHVKHRIEHTSSADASGAGDMVAEADDTDTDEDFPDAKLETASDSDDGEGDNQEDRANPLEASGSTDNETISQNRSGLGVESAKGTNSDDNKDEAKHESSKNITEAKSQLIKSGRYMSARERRQLRKGNTDDVLDAARANLSTEDEPEDGTDSLDDTAPIASSEANSTKTGPKPLPRGKRAKAKRIAAKYANQDDEDRELALRLLGNQPSQQAQSANSAETQKGKEQEALEQKQRRREQHLKAQALGKAAEEERRARFAAAAAAAAPATEGSNDQPEDGEDGAVQTPLDALVGRPHADDSIVLALPVCAPYLALSNYKYKVKLQPGTVKKGKAVKEILSRWDAAQKEPKNVDREGRDNERMWPSEIEAMKAWNEAEVFGVVPVGKVRIVQGGGTGGGGGGSGGAGKGKGGAKKSSRGGRGSKRK